MGREKVIKTSLFFNPDFKFDLDWKNKFKILIGSLSASNRLQVSHSIQDLSNASIRHRFFGSKKEFSLEELDYYTKLDGWNHYALGIEESENLRRGVATARMVRSVENPHEAEIAITIIDSYQGMGLGKLLMQSIVLAASERNIDRLSFTFMPQNIGIIKLINLIGPTIKGAIEMDYVQLFIEMKEVDLEKIKSQLATSLPLIDTFRSKI